jgi:hypothetical protein
MVFTRTSMKRITKVSHGCGNCFHVFRNNGLLVLLISRGKRMALKRILQISPGQTKKFGS